jgi:hypothetical protein
MLTSCLCLEKAGIDFICCDMPHANRLTVSVMALVAEEEGRVISRRTKKPSPPPGGEISSSEANAATSMASYWLSPRRLRQRVGKF